MMSRSQAQIDVAAEFDEVRRPGFCSAISATTRVTCSHRLDGRRPTQPGGPVECRMIPRPQRGRADSHTCPVTDRHASGNRSAPQTSRSVRPIAAARHISRKMMRPETTMGDEIGLRETSVRHRKNLRYRSVIQVSSRSRRPDLSTTFHDRRPDGSFS